MAKVLLIIIELLVVKMVGETIGKADGHEEAAPSLVASLRVIYLVGIFPAMIEDSSSSCLYDSPSHASRMPDPLLRRPIEFLT